MSQVRNVPVAETNFLVRCDGEGAGTPALLLHGVPETSTCWREVAPHLPGGRRVLCPDLPGLGGSTYTGPYDVPALVGQLAALVEAEVPDGRVDVVGHDWGGVLALAMTALRPDLVRRLAVLNAPFRDVSLLRAPHIPFFALPLAPELLFRLGGHRVVGTMLALGWKAPGELAPEVRAEYVAAYTDPARVTAMLGYYRGVARPRLRQLLTRSAPERLPEVSAERMLVLWGALDPVLPISLGESVVRDLGPACTMVTVPGAGHFVVEEAPAVVVAALCELLADADADAFPAGRATSGGTG